MKPILDVCCGSKMFYFDKNNPNVCYMDKRIMYSPTWTYKEFLEWFKDWLSKYDDIELSAEDNKELGRITHILRFECKF